jgi:membrane fusion protein (multidrug efflux system)
VLASARAELALVQADIRAAEVQYDRDREDLERFREMAASATVSAQQLAHARATEKVSAAQLESVRGRVETRQAQVEQAAAALQVAEDTLKQAQSQVATRSAQREEVKARLLGAQSAPQRVAYSRSQATAAQAEIAQARALVEQAELNLSYTVVGAPCSGYVTRKAVEPGSSVQVGQSLLALVPREVWVVANFKETQLTRMRPGQPAVVEVDAYPGVAFRAHVDSIQRGTGARFALLPPENATGNFVKVVQRLPVKLVFDDLEQVVGYPLAPGMSAEPVVDVTAPGRSAGVPLSLSGDTPSASVDGENRAR